jgi:hypothetical protein
LFINDKNERHRVRFYFKTMQGIQNWTNAEAAEKGFSVVALREFRCDQQVAGSSETLFEWCVPHDPDRFHVQARPGCRTASDDLRGVMATTERGSIPTGRRRRLIFGKRALGRSRKNIGLIQGRFGEAGHVRFHSLLCSLLTPDVLLVGDLDLDQDVEHAALTSS